MSHSEILDARLEEREAWVFRRQKGIPANKRLFILTCMDERIPVEEVLGLQPGDAHIFRNAGGFATGDAIRSAALSIHFFETSEIIIVNHTECGMLSATGEDVSAVIEQRLQLDLSSVALDPALPDFRLTKADISRWWRMQANIDDASIAQVEAFRTHPLIPNDIPISSYVYEVESGRLRKPGDLYTPNTAVTIAIRAPRQRP